MSQILTGGGTSLPAGSAHSVCQRFIGTDPIATGVTRRRLAEQLGHPDTSGSIPQARWVRAMTFERVLEQPDVAKKFVTKALGGLGLGRPAAISVVTATTDAHDDETAVAATLAALRTAHERAVADGVATFLSALSVPFPGVDEPATPVKPDFTVVAPAPGEGRSWLVVGDVKDYEPVRSRIDDGRLLKGFLQVAVGAEGAAAWSDLPHGMEVHGWGVLAVPASPFLTPRPVLEDLVDHRAEARDRIAERLSAREEALQWADAAEFAAHLTATYDPRRCRSCALFNYCRTQLRASQDIEDVLVEIGVPEGHRDQAAPVLRGGQPGPDVPPRLASAVRATITGQGQRTGQRRIDGAGEPNTINVVLAKSDEGALGVHGMSLRTVATGDAEWKSFVFDSPLSVETRRKVMTELGRAVSLTMRESRKAAEADEAPAPVHIVLPDAVTADLLVSIADNLAGVELQRMRWARDREQGRVAVTFDGEPADVPQKLRSDARTAVSFLLEADRSRAISVRTALVDLRSVLARLVVGGGSEFDQLRLDYLVEWAGDPDAGFLDHRVVADHTEDSPHTPGARLTAGTSDALYAALKDRDPATHERLVLEELAYKQSVVDRTIGALQSFPVSLVRNAYALIELESQAVWHRRLAREASDLVRFGRVYRRWRNAQVAQVEASSTCDTLLTLLSNPDEAMRAALDPGNRDVGLLVVEESVPLRVRSLMRQVDEDEQLAVLHVERAPLADEAGVEMTALAKELKVTGLPVGVLRVTADGGQEFVSDVPVPLVAPGNVLVVARGSRFDATKGGALKVERPQADADFGPTADCHPNAFADDPDAHNWCCKPHAVSEAEWSDQLAERRRLGRANPDVWPPVVDQDGFEVVGRNESTAETVDVPDAPVDDALSLSDID